MDGQWWVAEEVERGVDEFLSGFPPDVVTRTKSIESWKNGRVHNLIHLMPSVEGGASVTIHVELGVPVVDLHIGEFADFEIQPRPCTRDNVRLELRNSLDSIAAGRYEETIWRNGRHVYKVAAHLEVEDGSWFLTKRTGFRLPLRKATREQIRFRPWTQAALNALL